VVGGAAGSFLTLISILLNQPASFDYATSSVPNYSSLWFLS
jgi:hypothetical protein